MIMPDDEYFLLVLILWLPFPIALFWWLINGGKW